MSCIGYAGDWPTVVTCSPSTKKATWAGVHSAGEAWNSRASIASRCAANSSPIDGSPNGCTPMPTAASSAPTVPAEDLADADLRRPLRLVLVADHPQGDHGSRGVGGPGAGLEQPVLRRVQPHVALRLAHHRSGVEAVLPTRAPDGPGEDGGLQRRHAHRAVE